ncbi:MAG: ABC transporter ATP-binding protein [Alphaproteobacteria bacterium]|jgi:putative ABC transport system ATP-binding protein
MTDLSIDLVDVRLTLGSDAGKVNVLRGVDLALARGETASLVGPSGSGKSSLLLVTAGLEPATSGQIHVGGQDLSGLGEDDRARFRRERIGFVFQAFHLIPSMTALENVATPLELAGRKDALDRATKELEAVGLGHRGAHLPSQLSGGEQQRVAIARAFAGDADILLADEPTGNLDGETGQTIIDLMFARAIERQASLLLVTHDTNLAARCDKQFQMADGLIVSQ